MSFSSISFTTRAGSSTNVCDTKSGGAGEGTRTPNHLFTRQVRCQLRHAGDSSILERRPGRSITVVEIGASEIDQSAKLMSDS